MRTMKACDEVRRCGQFGIDDQEFWLQIQLQHQESGIRRTFRGVSGIPGRVEQMAEPKDETQIAVNYEHGFQTNASFDAEITLMKSCVQFAVQHVYRFVLSILYQRASPRDEKNTELRKEMCH